MCGLRSEAALKKLLTQKDLTFQSAVEIAQSIETASEKTKELQSPTTAAEQRGVAEDVCKVSSWNQGRESLNSCYRCGKANHSPSKCPFKSARCHGYGKIGHINRVCRGSIRKKAEPLQVKNVQESETAEECHGLMHVQESETAEDCHGLMYANQQSRSIHPYKVDILVEGQLLSMEIDTGAVISLVSEQTFKTLFPELVCSQ